MLGPRCIACKRLVTLLVALLTLLPGAAALAEPACSRGAFRDFDFWLGEWSVRGADGGPAGHNTITREQGGCVLVERWRSATGSTGTSLNFFDPSRGAWRQVWVSPGLQIDIAGGLSGDSMVLEGTAVYLDDGRSRPFRGTWTPLDDGRVRQFFEEHNEAGEWTPWFEGFYQRAPASSDAR